MWESQLFDDAFKLAERQMLSVLIANVQTWGKSKTVKYYLGTKSFGLRICILLVLHVTALVLCIITKQHQEHVELDDQNDNIKKGIAYFGFDTYL